MDIDVAKREKAGHIGADAGSSIGSRNEGSRRGCWCYRMSGELGDRDSYPFKDGKGGCVTSLSERVSKARTEKRRLNTSAH